MNRALLSSSLIALAIFFPLSALAAPTANHQALFDRAVQALGRGEFQVSVQEFEALADAGVVSPALSYNRGLAYFGRAASGVARPGDLGQAAAAFTEALELSPSDPRAQALLEETQGKLLAKRKGPNQTRVDLTPLRLRVLAAIAPRFLLWVEYTLGIALALLLVGSARATSARGALWAMTWTVAGLLSLSLLLAFGQSVYARYAPYVVIAEQAIPSDENGQVLARSTPYLEGQTVQAEATQDGKARVISENGDHFLPLTSLRRIAAVP